VLAFTEGGTVRALCVQQGCGCSGGESTVGRSFGSESEAGRSGQRNLPSAAGQEARWKPSLSSEEVRPLRAAAYRLAGS
jgi:hypothetical protein